MRWLLSFLLLFLVSGVGCDANKTEEKEAETASEQPPPVEESGQKEKEEKEAETEVKRPPSVKEKKGKNNLLEKRGGGGDLGDKESLRDLDAALRASNDGIVSMGPEGLGMKGIGSGGNVISMDTNTWYEIPMEAPSEFEGAGEKGDVQFTIGTGKTANFNCKKDVLRNAILRRGEAIRGCYESRLLSEPDLKGQLTVRWTINPAGKVHKTAMIDKSLNDTVVEDCVLRVARRTRFKRPRGGYCVFQWPFVFGSN